MRLITDGSLAAVPRLVHGFERRGPEGETREQTRSRVRQALRRQGQVGFLAQVHGAQIQRAPWSGRPEADAGLTAQPGWIVAVETADCVPILLVEPERHLALAVHAGWRGTVAGIATRAVQHIRQAGGAAHRTLAAIGPSIGPCCYFVGDELKAAFGTVADRVLRQTPQGRLVLDLREANRLQLLEAGVTEISVVDECTSCRPRDYFSFRRDGAGTGRMVSFVGWSAEV